MRATAAARFTGGGGTLGQPPAVRLVVKVSMQLIGVSKGVIFELFELQRDDVLATWGSLAAEVLMEEAA